MRHFRTASFYKEGEGFSYNARCAMEDGRMSLTRAIKVVAIATKVTQKEARKMLLSQGACEWHHVGKYAMRVNFYDTNLTIRTKTANAV